MGDGTRKRSNKPVHRAYISCNGAISVVQPSWRSFPQTVQEQAKKPVDEMELVFADIDLDDQCFGCFYEVSWCTNSGKSSGSVSQVADDTSNALFIGPDGFEVHFDVQEMVDETLERPTFACDEVVAHDAALECSESDGGGSELSRTGVIQTLSEYRSPGLKNLKEPTRTDDGPRRTNFMRTYRPISTSSCPLSASRLERNQGSAATTRAAANPVTRTQSYRSNLSETPSPGILIKFSKRPRDEGTREVRLDCRESRNRREPVHPRSTSWKFRRARLYAKRISAHSGETQACQDIVPAARNNELAPKALIWSTIGVDVICQFPIRTFKMYSSPLPFGQVNSPMRNKREVGSLMAFATAICFLESSFLEHTGNNVRVIPSLVVFSSVKKAISVNDLFISILSVRQGNVNLPSTTCVSRKGSLVRRPQGGSITTSGSRDPHNLRTNKALRT
ncbi:uncharacterized protein FOMMEDRAFT_149899 [Fomitiporia mediterranea MF3/22]|uniref:uncharacterized protein n=1 Tax=Fomitiporia mediterranea (strain MF3/22) TaxID=694068 RepID=UPI0004407E27|nr:uncharacterized protein FOMMEDRAFT_149899 [Fomitiporia mediterranea MF3/22]EJD07377.1 hypothetical protein FOMMEDRAFT_149899 [Fomitiporia mediterranea MF3/22]